MTSALLGILLLTQQPASIGFAPIGSKQVPITIPTSHGKFNLTSWVDSAQNTYEVIDESTLGVEFLPGGGWEAVAQQFPALQAQLATAEPSHIKVLVVTDVLIADTGNWPNIGRRRGFVNEPLKAEIESALARAYAAIVVATQGKVKPIIDLEYDNATYVQEMSASHKVADGYLGEISLKPKSQPDVAFGIDFLAKRILPKVNTTEFKSDDPTFRGPFDFVAVLHAGLVDGESTAWIGPNPVWTVPVITSTQEKVESALASKLYYQYIYSKNIVPGSDHLTPWTSRWTRQVPEPDVLARQSGAEQKNITMEEGTTIQGLSVSSPDQAIGYGDFSIEKVGENLTITRIGSNTQGDVLLMGGVYPQAPALPLKNILSLTLSGAMRDPWAVNFLNSKGEIVGSAQLSGEAFQAKTSEGPAPTFTVFDAIQPVPSAEGATQQYKINLGPFLDKGVTAITLGPPPLARYFNRQIGGKEVVTIHGFAFEDGTAPDAIPLARTGPFSGFGELGSELTSTQVQEILAALQGKNDEAIINAAAVLRRYKLPEAVPLLTPFLSKVDDNINYQVSQALAFQATPEAVAALNAILMAGPFDLNRAMALDALSEPASEEQLDPLRFLVINRNWCVRKEAADRLADLSAEGATAALLASFPDPEPAVRAAIARAMDPNHELSARRLSFNAVNDPNEFVRLACLETIINSKIPAVAEEGYKGVRDESLAVRLALIQTMAENPKPAYRTALQTAMIDTDPLVITAALHAFQSMDGVELREVQTSLTFQDEDVILALLQLAESKGIKLPADYLNQQASSQNDTIKALAIKLRGSL